MISSSVSQVVCDEDMLGSQDEGRSLWIEKMIRVGTCVMTLRKRVKEELRSRNRGSIGGGT